MSDQFQQEGGFDAWLEEHRAKAAPAWFERKTTVVLMCGVLIVVACMVLAPARPAGSVAEASSSTSASISDIPSETVDMQFDDCVDHIQTVAGKLGTTPVNIVETNAMRMVRLPASDGSVLITCSALDDTMVVTRSPYS